MEFTAADISPAAAAATLFAVGGVGMVVWELTRLIDEERQHRERLREH